MAIAKIERNFVYEVSKGIFTKETPSSVELGVFVFIGIRNSILETLLGKLILFGIHKA